MNKSTNIDSNAYIRISERQLFTYRFFQNKASIVGLAILTFMFFFSFAGARLSPYGEYEMFFSYNGVELDAKEEVDYGAHGVAIYKKSPPSFRHWMGTDQNGCDVLTRLMYGGRVSLTVGICVIAIESLIGALVGGIAGYYGSFADAILMRIVDIFNCIPRFPIMLIFSALMVSMKTPQQHRIYYVMLIISFLDWPVTARVVRGQILSLRERDFMIAAEAVGLSAWSKIVNHLIPNVFPQLLVCVALQIGSVILFEAALSFLGMGVAVPYASWGNMVNAVTDPIIMKECFFMWIPPGICILLTVMGFNLVADGLRNAFDPK